MNIALLTIRFRVFASVACVVLAFAGVWAYQEMGRLEDPEFSIKQAQIITRYLGASAQEVAEEVTDGIERALQRMEQIERVTSVSEPGRSTVTVVIRDRFTSRDLPQIWDELRRRVQDAARALPPGASDPIVYDDYGDVYGVFYAVYGDGYSFAELRDHAEMLRRELLLVDGVGKITLFGEQQEVVYIEFARERLAQIGIPPEALYASLEGQNLAAPSGRVRAGGMMLRIDPTGQFRSVEDIGDLLVLHPAAAGKRLYLRDVATITRGYIDPPSAMMRFNGHEAVGLAISTVPGGNVVRMGEGVRERVQELAASTPIGIELGLIAHQADAVNEAVNSFIMSLLQSIAIIIGVLMISMGLRSGVLIGAVLALTVLATFVVMHATGIMIERVSLGALIIAMGMLIDNAIVIIDLMLVGMRRGLDRTTAAARAVRQSWAPLLGATVVAILSFAAIGLSQDSTGEYTRSLFLVMLYALGLSWVISITITPLLGYWFLKVPPAVPDRDPAEPGDLYKGRIYLGYRRLLAVAIRRRWATVLAMLLLLGGSVIAFGRVDQTFFPPSTRAQFMVHIWLSEGSQIEQTRDVADELTRATLAMPGVRDVSAFIGAGAPRFILTYSPESSNSSYAMLLVTVNDSALIGGLMRDVESHASESAPQAEAFARRFSLGPGDLQKIRVRLRGPDEEVLSALSNSVAEAFERDTDIIDIRDDWRGRVPMIRPVVSETHAREAGLTRRDIARAMLYHTEGVRIGVYREGEDLLPIIARPPSGERRGVEDLRDAYIWSPASDRRIPIRQVVGEFRTESEPGRIQRRDRLSTVTLSADSATANPAAVVARLRPVLDQIPIPIGYTLDWGGEDESSRDARAGIFRSFPLIGMLMALTVIGLFNAFRPPLIVAMVVPLAITGVAFGLLVTGQPFGFMALLGFMSLVGMLIKNAVVLLDEIGTRFREPIDRPIPVLLDAGVSRLRPVTIASLTTILGMIPLLKDAFFVSMAVTIMSGLMFATVLTLIVVPVLYAILYRLSDD
ncbi:MAG: efflux RND transporter permease subunit [Phycisphaerales bacterium]